MYWKRVIKGIVIFFKILEFKGLWGEGTVITVISVSAFLWHIFQDKASTLFTKSVWKLLKKNAITVKKDAILVSGGHSGTPSNPFICPISSQIHLLLQGMDTEEFHHFSQYVYIISVLGLIVKFTDIMEARYNMISFSLLRLSPSKLVVICFVLFVWPSGSQTLLCRRATWGIFFLIHRECWTPSPDFLIQ